MYSNVVCPLTVVIEYYYYSTVGLKIISADVWSDASHLGSKL